MAGRGSLRWSGSREDLSGGLVRQWSLLWPSPYRSLLRASGQPADATDQRHAAEASGAAHAHAAPPDAEFEAFIREHQRVILNYLWRMTGDEQNAYDLSQEVFVRAWRRFGALRGYEKPRAWLFRVATNLALTSLARRASAFASVEALSDEREPAESDPAWRIVERDLVRAALAALPPRRRAALTLREVYGLSCAEVARALGISDAAARMTLSRAREQFRTLYLREGGDEDGA